MRPQTPARRWLAALLLLAGAAMCAPAGAQVAVVVGAAARMPPWGQAELAPVWLRHRQFADGVRLQPVNLPAGQTLRRWFSQQVLGQSPEELEGYWRDQYFNGVLPPYVLASEEAVLRFVATTPGAIGYVPACLVDKRVRVLVLLEGGPPCPR